MENLMQNKRFGSPIVKPYDSVCLVVSAQSETTYVTRYLPTVTGYIFIWFHLYLYSSTSFSIRPHNILASL